MQTVACFKTYLTLSIHENAFSCTLKLLYPKIKSFLHADNLKLKYLKLIVDGCLVSFSAWLGTMGSVAYYFKIFSPITVLANLLSL